MSLRTISASPLATSLPLRPLHFIAYHSTLPLLPSYNTTHLYIPITSKLITKPCIVRHMSKYFPLNMLISGEDAHIPYIFIRDHQMVHTVVTYP